MSIAGVVQNIKIKSCYSLECDYWLEGWQIFGILSMSDKTPTREGLKTGFNWGRSKAGRPGALVNPGWENSLCIWEFNVWPCKKWVVEILRNQYRGDIVAQWKEHPSKRENPVKLLRKVLDWWITWKSLCPCLTDVILSSSAFWSWPTIFHRGPPFPSSYFYYVNEDSAERGEIEEVKLGITWLYPHALSTGHSSSKGLLFFWAYFPPGGGILQVTLL